MRTALIISNDLNNVEHLSHYLQQKGYIANLLSNGDAIKEMLNSSNPNLIFLDIILPKRSGFEVCRELKSDSKSRKIPVIILSGGDNNIGQTWREMLGADGYLLKPIDQEKLSTVLQQLHTKKI